jgi:hypothetical protein
LWQWQTGAGADAPAITYEIDGVQYLAIAVGGLATQTASTNGDMVWAFSLQGSPKNRVAQFEAPPPPPTGVTFGFTGLLKGGVPIVTTNAVRMIDYNFTPPRIAVEAGSKVTFTNSGHLHSPRRHGLDWFIPEPLGGFEIDDELEPCRPHHLLSTADALTTRAKYATYPRKEEGLL